MAGFDVTGVDMQPQPRYAGDRFIQADALEYVTAHGQEYHAIHASPPCQGYSVMHNATGADAPLLIEPTRALLRQCGRPYVIENVELAKSEMRAPITLCGTMFGIRVRRHRLFEIQPSLLLLLPPCSCRNGVRDGRLIGQMLSGKVAPGRTPRNGYRESDRRSAIGAEWMTTMEARQAIPPAYTRFIGAALLETMTTTDRPPHVGFAQPAAAHALGSQPR
jgi:DNA (cytosine-5)-methyltransferase 1